MDSSNSTLSPSIDEKSILGGVSAEDMQGNEKSESPSNEKNVIQSLNSNINENILMDTIEFDEKNVTTSHNNSEEFESMTEAFKAAISEKSPSKSDVVNAAETKAAFPAFDSFDEDSCNKFDDLENRVLGILSDISREEQENSKQETNEQDAEDNVSVNETTSATISKIPEKKIEDTDDVSVDCDNDGDTLGLLAETEGRERHFSDPEDEDDEEEGDGDGDIEMEEEHLESGMDSDVGEGDDEEGEYSNSNDGDDDYKPKSDEEEDEQDDEEEDDNDPELRTYVKRKKLLKDLHRHTYQPSDSNDTMESQTPFQTDMDTAESRTSDVEPGEIMFSSVKEDTNSFSVNDKPVLSICSVSSLVGSLQDSHSEDNKRETETLNLGSDVSKVLDGETLHLKDYASQEDSANIISKDVSEEIIIEEDNSKNISMTISTDISTNIVPQILSTQSKNEVTKMSQEQDEPLVKVKESISVNDSPKDNLESAKENLEKYSQLMDVDEDIVSEETKDAIKSDKLLEKDSSTQKKDDSTKSSAEIIEQLSDTYNEKKVVAENPSDDVISPVNETKSIDSDVEMKDASPDTIDSSQPADTKRKNEEPTKDKTSLEVFSLDSDDENTETANISVDVEKKSSVECIVSEIKPKTRPKKDIEEKHVKPGEKCINPTCMQSNDLQPCPLYLPSVYRARDTPNNPKACKKCIEEGISLMEKLSSRLRAGYCLLDVEIPSSQDLVEISDSDSEDDSKNTNQRLINGGWRKKGLPKPTAEELIKDVEKDYINQVLPDLFTKVWCKFDVDKQIQSCEESLVKKMNILDDECANLEKLINQEQVQLDMIRTKLYETFRYPTECKTEVIITENGDHTEENSLVPERRSVRLKKQFQLNKPPEVLPPATMEGPPCTADSVVVNNIQEFAVSLESLPSKGRLPDYALNVGDKVYAVRQSIFGAWCLAQIVRVMPRGTKLANGTLSQFSLVTVYFVQGGEGEQVTKQVTGRQVAYATPSTVMYSVGTRIIALFQNKQQLKEAYYSGVIAEIPVKANRFRYLVFFDDGYSRYVYHKFILLVCQRSNHAWEDIHPVSRGFIRKYLEGFPNQPMVRVQAGQSIRAEYKGKFLMASVVAVDSSLALIKFNENSGAPANHEEWIYRGSTRLEPLFLELQAADRKSHGRHRPSYATTNLNKSKHFPYVEYSRPDQSEGDNASNATESQSNLPPPSPAKETKEQTSGTRAVAKKSTSNKDDSSKYKDKDEVPASTQQMHADQVKSKVVYYSPKVTIKPKKLTPHTCGPDCLNKDAIALRELRNYNPLARPLLSGWQRLIIKFRGKRTIMYHAPCGRRLRNAKELHLYLRLTRSQMSVDLFDFDHWVHCLAEFVPTKCFVSKKDLSHGVEAVPVPCVNYYDNALPEFSAYSTRRIPTRGVNLNLDEEFLCGCDCTDDCQDRNKCQCWQLTLEGASVIGSQLSRVGYQYKRLLEPVPTGIYECNSRCKCAATCLNRVVQHPLQLKLQVFKTFNRGWGIRALNDVSKGTFICIYAGNLLTDAVANVDGVTEGDEYLAELDYIEVVEKLKENYESDVPEEDKDFDEESEEPSDNEKISDAGKEKKTGPHGESDEEFKPHTKIDSGDVTGIATRRQLRKKKSDRNAKNSKDSKVLESTEEKVEKEKEKEHSKIETAEKNSGWEDEGAVPVVDEFITISDDEEKREPSRFAAPDDLNDDDKYVSKHRSVRSFFGKDEACYIMDAKVQGNLGRYLNHSCSPNVFVQNVFVDTHDPRFPWVAFFTLNHVRAGTELTWNYNYDVGSVPGKVMFCRCGATNCRGRLL